MSEKNRRYEEGSLADQRTAEKGDAGSGTPRGDAATATSYENDQPAEAEGGTTVNHAGSDVTSASRGPAARNLTGERGQTDPDAGMETGFGADYGDTAGAVAVGSRDEEEADEMPGGAAGYAGRGGTGSGIEAPGGAEGYSSDRLPKDADEVDDD